MKTRQIIQVTILVLIVGAILVGGVLLYIPPKNNLADLEVHTNHEGFIEIHTLEELEQIRFFLDRNFILMQDIDISQSERSKRNAHKENKTNVIPIGTKKKPVYDIDTGRIKGRGFTGVLEGNNKKIIGLIIDERNRDFVGLFPYIDGGVVQNLTLVNPVVRGMHYVGAISAYIDEGSIVQNIRIVKGEITGKAKIGSIVGVNDYGVSISGIVEEITIEGIEESEYLGGLVGMNTGGEVQGYFSGSVKGNRIIGGLVGYDNGIAKGFVEGYVIGDEVVGGLVGYARESTTIGYVGARVQGLRTVGCVAGVSGAQLDENRQIIERVGVAPAFVEYGYLYGYWDIQATMCSDSIGKIIATQNSSVGISSITKLKLEGEVFQDTTVNKRVFVNSKFLEVFSVNTKFNATEIKPRQSVYGILLELKDFVDEVKELEDGVDMSTGGTAD